MQRRQRENPSNPEDAVFAASVRLDGLADRTTIVAARQTTLILQNKRQRGEINGS
jgi:hypothetical protein